MKSKWLVTVLLVIVFFIIILLNLPKITKRLTGEDKIQTADKDNTVLTAEEKSKLGLDESYPAQALRRDNSGNVLIYEVDKSGLPKDSDKDGLSDDKEEVIGTNPNNKDSDQDGMPDGQEILLNFKPLDSESPWPKKK